MKLLVVTQVIDQNDPVLGFFHQWVVALSKHYDHITVICLKEGTHSLPENVQVFSLGKENGNLSKRVYASRFLKLTWKLRTQYDRVFVHMNQEYILIAGWLWEILNKKVYMWRNHYAGNWLTDVAASTCTKVFCTSRYSYTAKYKKTVIMPVGINLDIFSPDPAVTRIPKSILFLARIAPSKHPDILIDAIVALKEKGVTVTASMYGDALPEHVTYADSLRQKVLQLGLQDIVTFHAGIPNTQTPDVYRAHEVFINISQSGMFDKTIFEAAACGCLVLAASKDYQLLVTEELHVTQTLEESIERVLTLPAEKKQELVVTLEGISRTESLAKLSQELFQQISK
jgi:glycosyltransferase involved in cell wall biosynthesis